MHKRNWLVFANKNKVNHAESFHKLGLISWVKSDNRRLFSIGDIVYVFMSDERCIRFKAIVEVENVAREDSAFWNVSAPHDNTYRLRLLEEYSGTELSEDILKEHGFKGGGSLQTPIWNKPELFDYIISIF